MQVRRTSNHWHVSSLGRVQSAPCPGDEVWLPAKYPGRDADIPDVMVSSHGRVFSQSANNNRVTYGSRMRTGYYAIQSQRRGLLVHRLVAATFLGQPQTPKLQVNHRDRDRGNNHLHNLEYVAPSQNALHALQHRGVTPPQRKGKVVLVRCSQAQGVWTRFESLAAASKYTGVSRQKILEICAGQNGTRWDFQLWNEQLDGEEWRPVILEGARTPKAKT